LNNLHILTAPSLINALSFKCPRVKKRTISCFEECFYHSARVLFVVID
jgi:hypothetical protein